MILTPAQKIIAKNKHRFRVVCIGRRGGKTTLAVEEIKGKAISKPSRIAYIAPTYQQARDIAWEQLKKELTGAIVSYNESRLEIKVKTQKGGESTIFLRGWESIETLRGQAFDFLVVDEIAMMRNFEQGWQEVLRPTLTDTMGEAMFISTPKGFNHFYDLYNTDDESFVSFHFTTYDNPHIPEEEIEEAKRQLTNSQFAQEYLAQFKKMEGLVYKEFNRDIHVIEEMPKLNLSETIGGLDFGYTNPFCALIVKKDHDNNYWVVDGVYKSGKTNEDIAEICKQLTKKHNVNQWYPDPESPEAIETMNRIGLNMREVIKGKDSVRSGIARVRNLFKTQRLKIHSSCKNLIWELETYKYKDKQENKNEPEEPMKENDHAVDALRYALMTNEPLIKEEEDLTLYHSSYK